MNGPALSRLLAPLDADVFRHEHWARRYVVVEGDPARFGAFAPTAVAGRLEHILGAYKNLVMAVGDAAIEASEGVADRFLVRPDEAMAWYTAGATLELDCAEMYLPGVRTFLDELREDLGLPTGCFAKAIVYASPYGGGFKPHFDAYANFVMQLRGRKVWWLAPNRHAQDPMEHYDLEEAPYLPPELRSYWHGAPAEAMPAEAIRVELKPGSLLFVPRGWWHRTEAQEDETLSLNFTFSQPTWLDLALGEVRGRLVKHARWRELADGVEAKDPTRRAAARARLSQVLRGLADDLGTPEVDHVLARGEEPHEVYQVANAVFRQLIRVR